MVVISGIAGRQATESVVALSGIYNTSEVKNGFAVGVSGEGVLCFKV